MASNLIPAHPLANLFPMLSPVDGLSLRADIGVNGQRERIIILDEAILDGRNRQDQLCALGLVDGKLPPPDSDLWLSRYRRFVPAQDGDPLAFVLSLNLHRRHLDESQRAMVAARISNLSVGRPTNTDVNSANLPNLSQGKAAELLHVSPRSVGAAKAVIEHGAPELIASVERGEIAASTAAEATKQLSVGDQVRLLQENSPREFAAAVREHRVTPRDARNVMNSRAQALDDLDYAPTPPWATRALLQVVLPHLGQSLTGATVREPSCGEGHISAVLQEARPRAIWATDIFDYSVGGVSPPGWQGTLDYLDPAQLLEEADWTVMNSPFGDRAEPFVQRALRESTVGVCAFLRLGWLETIGRYNRLFGVTPPTLVAIWSERVPLHMGRWEPDGSTATPYCWVIWVKNMAPQPLFWIPPGQCAALSKPDDVARFTAHPVVGMVEAASAAAVVSAAIAHTMATAEPILRARYDGTNARQLALELDRSVGCVRGWLFRLGLTDRSRLQANATHLGAHLKTKETQE